MGSSDIGGRVWMVYSDQCKSGPHMLPPMVSFMRGRCTGKLTYTYNTLSWLKDVLWMEVDSNSTHLVKSRKPKYHFFLGLEQTIDSKWYGTNLNGSCWSASSMVASYADSGNSKSVWASPLDEVIPSAYRMSEGEGSYSILDISTTCRNWHLWDSSSGTTKANHCGYQRCHWMEWKGKLFKDVIEW